MLSTSKKKAAICRWLLLFIVFDQAPVHTSVDDHVKIATTTTTTPIAVRSRNITFDPTMTF